MLTVFKIQKWQPGEIVAHKLDPVKSTGCKYFWKYIFATNPVVNYFATF